MCTVSSAESVLSIDRGFSTQTKRWVAANTALYAMVCHDSLFSEGCWPSLAANAACNVAVPVGSAVWGMFKKLSMRRGRLLLVSSPGFCTRVL